MLGHVPPLRDARRGDTSAGHAGKRSGAFNSRRETMTGNTLTQAAEACLQHRAVG
jgi:hypothetical protein